MNRKSFLLLACFLIAVQSDISAAFKAGVSIRKVTPNPLLPVSGGVGPSNPTSRKEGDLTVRALVLEQDKVRVAIVGADFLGFPSALGNKVRAKVQSIPASHILIGVTHTHSAPDCYGFPDEQGKVSCDLNYLDMVCNQMAESINEAVNRLQPAQIKIATGKTKGKIAYNYYADKLYDPRGHVIQAVTPEGTAIATLVNYAIHPEVLGSDQGILSPDLVGPLYDRISEKGGGVAIFMNSAQGGMVTADCRGPEGKDIQTWAECIRIGQTLADEALRIIQDAPVQKDPVLFCAAKTITFPVDSPLMRTIMKISPLGFKSEKEGWISTQMNMINLGNAQILTIPGEALPNIGFYLKRKMHGKHNLLFGLTNDAFGYLLTKEDWDSFERYNYITRTSLGEMTGEIFINESLKFLSEQPKPAQIP